MRRHQAIRTDAPACSADIEHDPDEIVQEWLWWQTVRQPRLHRRPPTVTFPPYFRTRLAPNAHRAAIWNHLCAYLQRWIPADADVLELGAGWCDFANNITARRVVAMDLDTTVRRAAAEQCAGRGG